MKAIEYLANIGVKVPKDLTEQVNNDLRVKGSKKERVEPRFVAVKEFDLTATKLPNQAKFLVMALGDQPVTYEEWGKLAAEAGMGTKQDPARIAAYYRKQLEEAGAIARA